MYVTEYLDGKVEVKYISAHSNHDLGNAELPHLPLPKGVKEEIAIKLSLGIPSERIMEGKYIGDGVFLDWGGGGKGFLDATPWNQY
jgi:hypothetical protein